MGLLTKKTEAEYQAEPKKETTKVIEPRLNVEFKDNCMIINNLTNGVVIPLKYVKGIDYRFNENDIVNKGGFAYVYTDIGSSPAATFTNYKEMEFIFNGLGYPMPVSEKVPDAVVVEE